MIWISKSDFIVISMQRNVEKQTQKTQCSGLGAKLEYINKYVTKQTNI